MYKDYIKPSVDRIAALVLLVFCLPIIIGTSLLIIVFNKTQPFFIQPRPGKDKKIFKLIKFRTMTNQKDENGNLLSDHLRITKLGQFLRKTSLDELPELLNILKGDMSLVGPRPLLEEYLDKYSPNQSMRHAVKPGITGLAQINGRNLLSWEEKFDLDLKYIENMSMKNDINIIFKTFFVVFNTSNINQSENITMKKFQGSYNESEKRKK
jgi:lipopolysaccharide/colanic/teichoic acid biosynthesis glycosyltransferase